MYVLCGGAKVFSLKPNMILAKRREGGRGRERERKGGGLVKL